MTQSPGSTVDTVGKAREKVADGTVVKMSDLLTTLVPGAQGAERPAKIPMPAAIKDDERKAIERLPEVFGKVVPTERRALQPVEVDALVEEKTVLDKIKKMVETRVANIRVTVYNHFDVEAESQPGFKPDEVMYDKDGHYILDGVATVSPSTTQTFKRETRGGAPTISEADLKALVDNPDFPDFTHEDYLAMTAPIRVVDENKFMLHLKKKPSLLAAVKAATKPGNKTSALNLRKTD